MKWYHFSFVCACMYMWCMVAPSTCIKFPIRKILDINLYVGHSRAKERLIMAVSS